MKRSKLVQTGRVLAATIIALSAVSSLAASNGLCGPSGCTLVFNSDGGLDQSLLDYQVGAIPTEGNWLAGMHNNHTISTLGGDGWQPIVGDFNNDSRDDLAVYKDGVFMIDWNMNGSFSIAFTTYTLPAAELDGRTIWNDNTIPVAGDWDGVGGDDFGIYTDGLFTLFPNKADVTDTISISFGRLPQIGGYLFAQMPISGPIDNNRAGIARVGVYFGNYVQYAPETVNSAYRFYDLENTTAVVGRAARPHAFSRPVIVDTNIGSETNYQFSFVIPPGFPAPDASICSEQDFHCGGLSNGTPQTQRPIIIPPDPFQ